MAWWGQFKATSQFYLYGKNNFTQTGYQAHRKEYETPDLLEDPDLSERVFMVTGANSGVGKELARYLASKKATVYMVCRSRQRAEEAQQEIVAAAAGSTKVHVLLADVGLEADVRRVWGEFVEHRKKASSGQPRLDALVCNAGALMSELTLTGEGVEVTFASHLLFGTYLLGSLAMPALKATPDGRLVVVSSGGMYNFSFPSWEVATATASSPDFKFDGQNAYAYAKRAQVLLCERWAAEHPTLKVVSCHPGWTTTPGVDSAYGESKKWLEPMRSPWEGSEGIAWLCVAPGTKIESGAFYLDRKPQVKHMAGAFFTEGKHTKNKPEEVDAMMAKLEDWANGRRPNQAELLDIKAKSAKARETPLKALDRKIDIKKFMGRWYVVANIPTFADKGTVNNVEEYSYDEEKKVIQVNFIYSNKELTKTSSLQQRAKITNDLGTQWSLSPKFGVYLPVNLPYLVVDCAEDYSTTIIGYPDRSYLWCMAREPNPPSAVVEGLIKKAQLLGYDGSKVLVVPQDWSKGLPAPMAVDPQLVGA